MGKWTYESLQEEALKYKSSVEFFKNSRSAYDAARKMGIRKDITTHFIKWKTPIKWTYELLKEEALKYKTIKEFRFNSPNCYAACTSRKIIRELTTHMEPLGHRYSRLVYAYEFPDNHAYVGLTYNKDKRHGEHMRDGRGPVYKQLETYLFIK